MPVPTKRILPWLGLLCTGASWLPAAPAKHDLYFCASMSSAFFIGSQVQRLNGLYRSTDRTEITHLGFNHPRVDAVAADPRDPKVLYIGALNGVLRSTDGGNSWRIMTSWDMTEAKGLAVDPHRPDRVVIALPDGIGVSEDRGETWERRQNGIRRAYTQTVGLDRSTAGRWLAATELGIYLTEDEGRQWRSVLATDATVTDLQQSPHDAKHWLASTQSNGVFASRDGGRTWQALRGVPAGQTLHNVYFDGEKRGRLVVCGWGVGVWVSEDDGRTWQDRTSNLPNPNVWRVAADPDHPGRLYASPHEAPVHRSDDFGRTWQPHWFEGATVWDFEFVPRS